jgi:pimeloyl-ACP methyl ester carboxylesterase
VPPITLGIAAAILAGFDWGARSANVVAALWPDRCQALVSVSGYLIGSQAAGQAPLPASYRGCPLGGVVTSSCPGGGPAR